VELLGFLPNNPQAPPVGQNVLHFAEAKPEKEFYNGST